MGIGRWEHLADQKPQELRDYVLDRVAEQLTDELRHFPPREISWEDPAAWARFRAVLEQPGRPPLEVFRVALELSRLELLHDVERVDSFWRGPLATELLPSPLEQETALFLVRWLTESALSFQEWAQGKFRHRELVTLIEKVEAQMLRGYRLRLD